MKRPSRSFEIALSAIACAAAAVALTVGSYVDVLLAAGYLVALFALMVPLAKNFIWGEVLAFLGAVLLAFLFCGFAILKLVPFAVFFGLHPLINWLQLRFIKKKPLHVAVFVGKAAWFDLAMWLTWTLVMVPLLGVENATWYPFVTKYFYWVLFVGGTLFFAVFDAMIFFCQRSMNNIIARIRR